MANEKSILCFGDSLTWGWIPVVEGAPTMRYPYEQRWTGAMAAELGEGYRISKKASVPARRAPMIPTIPV